MDASGEGLGAVLSQKANAGGEQVIAYASRALTKSERKYAATRKEMLALVWGIKHFRPYLYGQSFEVRTDHNSLKWLYSFREPEGQIARWLEVLAEYEFTITHRPGVKHTNADALSRSSLEHPHSLELTAAPVSPVYSNNWLGATTPGSNSSCPAGRPQPIGSSDMARRGCCASALPKELQQSTPNTLESKTPFDSPEWYCLPLLERCARKRHQP